MPRTGPASSSGRRARSRSCMLRFDPRTGARERLADAVRRSQGEHGDALPDRRDAGAPRPPTRGTMLLIAAGEPWRADWLTFGPDRRRLDEARRRRRRVRIFAVAGSDAGRVTRTLTLGVRAPFDVEARPFRVDLEPRQARPPSRTAVGRSWSRFRVCVPARRVQRRARSRRPEHVGDLRRHAGRGRRSRCPRRAGVLFTRDRAWPTSSGPPATRRAALAQTDLTPARHARSARALGNARRP